MFAQSTKPVWYEPHPVTVERKAELRAKGFVILDAVFMPADHIQPDDSNPASSVPREDGPTISEFLAAGYQAANYPPAGYASRSTEAEVAAAIAVQAGDSRATANELRAALTAKGIPFKVSASKAELQALLTLEK